MSDELPDLPSLRAMEPPPNGLSDLRAAMARDDERRRARVRWALAVVPVAAILLVVLWLRRDGEPMEVPRPAPIAEAHPDLSIAPTFYWVASTPTPPPEPARPGVVYIDIEHTTPIVQLQLR